MVTMFSALPELMCSIMAARVVDLPLPVVPVTITSPRRLLEMSLKAKGRLSSS